MFFQSNRTLSLSIHHDRDCFDVVCSQVAYNPKVLLPYVKFGDDAEIAVLDSATLCNVGEELAFWDLMIRAQVRTLCVLRVSDRCLPARAGMLLASHWSKSFAATGVVGL